VQKSAIDRVLALVPSMLKNERRHRRKREYAKHDIKHCCHR